MGKLIICLLLSVAFIGCDVSMKKPGTETNSLIDRFENEEVVCYYSYKIGIFCKWKNNNERKN